MLENLPPATITALLNILPIDLTYMDADNRIQWFSNHRIFSRPSEIIGSDVHQCHQPSSWPTIDRMVADFKTGARDVEEHFVVKSDGRKLHIRYLAVRNTANQYLGLVEMAEEIKQPSPVSHPDITA